MDRNLALIIYIICEALLVAACWKGFSSSGSQSLWWFHFAIVGAAAGLGAAKQAMKLIGLRDLAKTLDNFHMLAAQVASLVGIACLGAAAVQSTFGYQFYCTIFVGVAAVLALVVITGNGNQKELEQPVHGVTVIALLLCSAMRFSQGNMYLGIGTILFLLAAGAKQSWKQRDFLTPDDVFHLLLAGAEYALTQAH